MQQQIQSGEGDTRTKIMEILAQVPTTQEQKGNTGAVVAASSTLQVPPNQNSVLSSQVGQHPVGAVELKSGDSPKKVSNNLQT